MGAANGAIRTITPAVNGSATAIRTKLRIARDAVGGIRQPALRRHAGEQLLADQCADRDKHVALRCAIVVECTSRHARFGNDMAVRSLRPTLAGWLTVE
jgi:hypothetical protein